MKSFTQFLEIKIQYDKRSELYVGQDGQEHWGFHELLDMMGCNANINDSNKIKEFLKELVDKLKMKAVGKPMVHSFGSGLEGGWSAMQMITTSSITLHGVNKNGSLYVDIFSCKPYDRNQAEKVVRKYFEPKKVKKQFIYRDAPGDASLNQKVSWIKGTKPDEDK